MNFFIQHYIVLNEKVYVLVFYQLLIRGTF